MITTPAIWRRLYRAESAKHRNWDLVVRGVRDLLIHVPESTDGVLLEHTKDPAGDLAIAMSIKPKDRKQFKASIAFLLADGYIVHEGGAVRIRNFLQAQTGTIASEGAPDSAASGIQSKPDLSEVRREAGRKGGLVAQAKRGFASSKPEQLATEQTEQLASSKTQASASARDPEAQRREEKISKESTTSLKTGQVVAREGSPMVVGEGGTLTQPEPRDTRIPCPSDLALLPAQRATLEAGFIPGWAIDDMTRSFTASACGNPDDRRPIDAWRKCLSKACCSIWNDSTRRPKKPDAAADEERRRRSEERQRRQREHEARELAEDTKRAEERLRKAGHDPDKLADIDIGALVEGIG